MKKYSAFELIDMLSPYCEVVLDFNLEVKYIIACNKARIVILNAHETFSEEEVKKIIEFVRK